MRDFSSALLSEPGKSGIGAFWKSRSLFVGLRISSKFCFCYTRVRNIRKEADGGPKIGDEHVTDPEDHESRSCSIFVKSLSSSISKKWIRIYVLSLLLAGWLAAGWLAGWLAGWFLKSFEVFWSFFCFLKFVWSCNSLEMPRGWWALRH